MRSADLATCGGQDLPAAVTLSSLKAGGVVAWLGTIFTEPDGKDAVGYPTGDAEAAAKRGREQLAVYQEWEAEGRLRIWRPSAARTALQSAGHGPLPTQDRPSMGILIEGADPIAGPEELAWWQSQGVVAIGLAWAKSSRYAGGNTTDEPLSPLGRELVREMDRLGIVHDASHLSDVALEQLFSMTDQPVIASHSNCRALIDTDGQRRQRHLTDATIREIPRRGGMIGVNVFSPFIIPGALRERRARIDEWLAHVERICDLIGDRSHIGLGSDMDGGFSASMMPEGVNSPSDLVLLADALADHGWTDPQVRGFCHDNWARFWEPRGGPPIETE